MFGRPAPDSSTLEQGRIAIFYWPWGGPADLTKFVTGAFGLLFDQYHAGRVPRLLFGQHGPGVRRGELPHVLRETVGECIHGRGKGIQRGMVQSVLERHPLVESFHDAYETHLGATVAVLRSSS